MKKGKKILLLFATVGLVGMGLIILLGMYKFNYLASQPGYDVDGNKVSVSQEQAQVDTINIPSEGGFQKVVPNAPVTTPSQEELTPQEPNEGPTSESFSGVFQEFGNACYADGACYAIVDDKKIVTIVGWSREVVGVFEDPNIPIGTLVEVYARKTAEDEYTLYGSSDYYIREQTQ